MSFRDKPAVLNLQIYILDIIMKRKIRRNIRKRITPTLFPYILMLYSFISNITKGNIGLSILYGGILLITSIIYIMLIRMGKFAAEQKGYLSKEIHQHVKNIRVLSRKHMKFCVDKEGDVSCLKCREYLEQRCKPNTHIYNETIQEMTIQEGNDLFHTIQ